ncbi:hypothetical protein CEH02_08650 [Streptococcus pyogenes]|nr:hypothetical protein [Streptococcus pyogenes]PMD81494.1 hypothetical protein CEH02_08650 [Streptococcus pyogenes]
MTENSIGNMTRLPISFFQALGWAEKVSGPSKYGKFRINILRITDLGLEKLNQIEQMYLLEFAGI